MLSVQQCLCVVCPSSACVSTCLPGCVVTSLSGSHHIQVDELCCRGPIQSRASAWATAFLQNAVLLFAHRLQPTQFCYLAGETALSGQYILTKDSCADPDKTPCIPGMLTHNASPLLNPWIPIVTLRTGLLKGKDCHCTHLAYVGTRIS